MRSTDEPLLLALFRLTWKARPRFGGYIVHVGVIMIAVGITASSAYEVETSSHLSPGESFSVRGYELTFNQVTNRPLGDVSESNPQYPQECGRSVNCRVGALVDVSRNDRTLTTLNPGVELLTTTRQPRTRVDIRSSWWDDLYLILMDWTQDGSVTIKTYHNPLVNYIWIGVLVMLFGGFYALIP